MDSFASKVHKRQMEEIRNIPRPSEKIQKLGYEGITWSRVMTELYKIRPRPLNKRYGQNPTPKEKEMHRAEESLWNSRYREASKYHKISGELTNDAIYKAQAAINKPAHETSMKEILAWTAKNNPSAYGGPPIEATGGTVARAGSGQGSSG